MAGNEFVGFSNATFLSEKSCADQNFAIGYFLKEHGVFPEGLLFYFFNQFYECVFSRQKFFNGDIRSGKSWRKSPRILFDFENTLPQEAEKGIQLKIFIVTLPPRLKHGRCFTHAFSHLADEHDKPLYCILHHPKPSHFRH